MLVFNERTETRRSVILSHSSVSRFHNFHRSDIHTSAFAIEEDMAFHERKQRVIATHSDVLARVPFGPALTDDDVTSDDKFATELLDAQAFRIGVTTVSAGPLPLLMSHDANPITAKSNVFRPPARPLERRRGSFAEMAVKRKSLDDFLLQKLRPIDQLSPKSFRQTRGPNAGWEIAPGTPSVPTSGHAANEDPKSPRRAACRDE